MRYGQAIGRAKRRNRARRAHPHAQSRLRRAARSTTNSRQARLRSPQPRKNVPTFLGYAREDGRAGTRNYIAVVAASNCAAHTAELIAPSYRRASDLPPDVDGVVAFPHGEGCGHAIGPDTDQLRRTLGGVLDHPNVAGSDHPRAWAARSTRSIITSGPNAPQSGRLVGMTLQGSRRHAAHGGGGAARRSRRFSSRPPPRSARRIAGLEDHPGTQLRRLGLLFRHHRQSGARASAPTCWPRSGRRSVLAETTEIFGAEHLLVKRARNREIAEKLLSFVENTSNT